MTWQNQSLALKFWKQLCSISNLLRISYRNFKKIIHFFMLIRAMIMRAPKYYLFFSISYTILGLSRAKNMIKLAFIVIGSFASDVFNQVMSLAKWLNVQSYEVGQVTGWKRVAILVNWCNCDVRDWKSDETLWWGVAKWSIRQAGSSKYEIL